MSRDTECKHHRLDKAKHRKRGSNRSALFSGPEQKQKMAIFIEKLDLLWSRDRGSLTILERVYVNVVGWWGEKRVKSKF